MENNDIKDILKQNAVDNRLSCAKAIGLSHKTAIHPNLVGLAMDDTGIKICDCQMGLFGCESGNKIVKPADNVPKKLEELIFSYLDDDGKLECEAAWGIAADMKISKMDVASACEALKIKINKCQLGAF